jgi:hypothetical protein
LGSDRRLKEARVSTEAVSPAVGAEAVRDLLAIVVCNAELALAMSGEAAVRERLERALAAAWRIDDALGGDPAPAH